MRILAIETSCDETAIAIIETAGGKTPSFRIHANLIASQIKLHARWGGVVPHLAKREHQRTLAPLLIQALRESGLLGITNHKLLRQRRIRLGRIVSNKIREQKFNILHSILERDPELLAQCKKHIILLKKPNIGLIAVTQGPGLEPALWVGVNFARALSMLWDKPLIGINHMEGHIFSALLEQKRISKIAYPALALLVSGGHTELVLIKRPLKYEIIGETRDDAVGEAFDKVARILGLRYPGGPAIATEAVKTLYQKRYTPNPKLPRPMIHTKDFDFSFSGLKTAALYLVKNLEKEGCDIKKLRPAIAKEFQDAVVDVLVRKTIRAAKAYKARMILLGGGVAANTQLRKELEAAIRKNIPNSRFYIPDTSLTGDNALMIAAVALLRRREAKKSAWKTLRPNAHIRL